jgi:hypothetical protein
MLCDPDFRACAKMIIVKKRLDLFDRDLRPGRDQAASPDY